MVQYHMPVNLERVEFIRPHKLGDGLKLAEQAWSGPGGVGSALILLLAASNGRGGGDFHRPGFDDVIGRWAGDRVAIVGDYAESHDLPLPEPGYPGHDAAEIWDLCENGEFTDISDRVCEALAAEGGFTYSGDGWRDRTPL